ncbi:glycoside hydrolase family 3 C-terminal domain-containing protein [Paenibacillus sp. OVF10]|nr:glycoside hydrolase family 3 C-terminal domain-containing protein [Paenibacillus sp. OVF10]
MNETNFDLQRYAAKARQAAAEGAVLLENDCNALPLTPGSKVALFGRSQFNYYKSGTGSGDWSIPNM